jgi:hypothetical protein
MSDVLEPGDDLLGGRHAEIGRNQYLLELIPKVGVQWTPLRRKTLDPDEGLARLLEGILEPP